MRKQFELIAEYEGMPDYGYVGLQVIQNEIDGATDPESYIPMDGAIQDFVHIPFEEVEEHPEHWQSIKL